MPTFQCSPLEQDFCLFGGNCSTNDELQTCICPEGFTADFSLFHFPNCSLPRFFYKYFLIISTLVSFPFIFYLVFAAYRSKGLQQRIDLLMFLTFLFAWGYHLALYVENGCYIGAIVCLLISLAAEIGLFSSFLVLFVQPLFSLRNDLRSFVMMVKNFATGKTFSMFTFFYFVPFGILLAYFSKQNDLNVYNNLVASFLIITCFLGSVLTSVLIHWINQVIWSLEQASINSNPKSDQIIKFIVKLQTFKKATVIAILDINVFVLPVPICYLILGSLPMTWVLTPVLAYSGVVVLISMSLIHSLRPRPVIAFSSQARAEQSPLPQFVPITSPATL